MDFSLMEVDGQTHLAKLTNTTVHITTIDHVPTSKKTTPTADPPTTRNNNAITTPTPDGRKGVVSEHAENVEAGPRWMMGPSTMAMPLFLMIAVIIAMTLTVLGPLTKHDTTPIENKSRIDNKLAGGAMHTTARKDNRHPIREEQEDWGRRTLETPGEALMGITDREARRKLAEVTDRITTYQQLHDKDTKKWAAEQLSNLPIVTLPTKQVLIEPGRDYRKDEAFRSLYTVRDFQTVDPVRETLHREMQMLTAVYTTGDGNCHDRSTMISIYDREEGHMGLRLRNTLLYIVRHNELYGHNNTGDLGELTRLATPEAWLDATATLLTAITLRCPIATVAPLGVENALAHVRLFVPPEVQPTARVMWKVWTGAKVTTPPQQEIPDSALYHYAAGLGMDTAHLERILSCLQPEHIQIRDVVGRDRGVIDPTIDPPEGRIDVDAPQITPPGRTEGTGEPERSNAVVTRQKAKSLTTNCKTTFQPPRGKNKEPAPKGQCKLDGWVTRISPKVRVARINPAMGDRHKTRGDTPLSTDPPTQCENRFQPIQPTTKEGEIEEGDKSKRTHGMKKRLTHTTKSGQCSKGRRKIENPYRTRVINKDLRTRRLVT